MKTKSEILLRILTLVRKPSNFRCWIISIIFPEFRLIIDELATLSHIVESEEGKIDC